MKCYCYLRNIQDLLGDDKTSYKRRYGESSKGPIVPFGTLIECHPSSPKDQTGVHQFGRKVSPGIFLDYALIAGGIWKGDILVADMEDLEKFNVSEIYPRRINAKETLIRQKDDEFIFPSADVTAKLSGKDYEFRWSTLRREPTVRSEDFSREIHDEPGESQPTETTDDAEVRAGFWSIQVTSSIVITMNLGFKVELFPSCSTEIYHPAENDFRNAWCRFKCVSN